MKFSLADSRVKMWTFSGVLGTVLRPWKGRFSVPETEILHILTRLPTLDNFIEPEFYLISFSYPENFTKHKD